MACRCHHPNTSIAVFTIGPRDEDEGALKKYGRLLSGSFDRNTNESKHVEELVRGVIEGETRVIAASLTMEVITSQPISHHFSMPHLRTFFTKQEIFQQRKLFKEQVIKNVQAELDQVTMANFL